MLRLLSNTCLLARNAVAALPVSSKFTSLVFLPYKNISAQNLCNAKNGKMASDWLFQIAWYFCTNQIASILVEHSLTSKMTSLHVNEISSGKLRYLVASIHFGAFLFFWALCYFFSSFNNRLWRLFSFQHS